ncbi:pseudouridine synthase [Marinibaculum pumilum]|uniref:Pseudouridine synthase n=1 Tax=Marinibaculum pumilum TaxID=1766165 RepID=A0ABV7KZ10_9PROT
MTQVETRQVAEDEAELRLDRWFRRHFPELPHGRLERLLRTGQVRVDGARAKAGTRLQPGQSIRVPPLPAPDPAARTAAGGARAAAGPARPAQAAPRPADIAMLRDRVLHMDPQVIVLDKPAGLAVQGGTNQQRHIDAMLDGLQFDAKERPRLVHRLDKDTSGVLVLARSAAVAAKLAAAFRGRDARKVYWAVTAGVPQQPEGRIVMPLVKAGRPGGQRVQVDDEEGQAAVTDYRVLDRAARRAALVELQPLTGRTHQLRVHCAQIGAPILGDGKYGGAAAHLPGGVARRLHLHARRITMPHPAGGVLDVAAELPEHMRETIAYLGFAAEETRDRH